MKLLIIEDDESVATAMGKVLADGGHGYDIRHTAADGLICLRRAQKTGGADTTDAYDAIILDINLPDSDGFQFTDTVRRLNITTPILVVSGRASVSDRVLALDTGADGYLVKPFDGGELLAMLTAIVRRSRGHASSSIRTGPIEVDLGRHEVRVDSAPLPLKLTAKEYEVLELLCLRKGMTLSKAHIMGHLYSDGHMPEAKIIDVFICKLRRKLSDATDGENYIHTVWGQGYVLRDEPESAHK